VIPVLRVGRLMLHWCEIAILYSTYVVWTYSGGLKNLQIYAITCYLNLSLSRMELKLLVILVMLATIVSCQEKPNIIIMFADDVRTNIFVSE